MSLSNVFGSASSTDSKQSQLSSRAYLRKSKGVHPAFFSRAARSAPRRPGTQRLDERGFGILGPVLLIAIFSTGVGLLGLRSTVRSRIDKQIRLDRRTGAAAAGLRAALRTLEASYQRMEYYRKATLVACPVIPTPLCPEAMAAFRLAGRAEGGLQLWVKSYWNMKRLQGSYPEFDFKIASGTQEDLLVNWENEYEKHTSNGFEVQAKDEHLLSKARVWKEQKNWRVAWTR